MQLTPPEGLEDTIPRSQAKAEKSDFLHGYTAQKLILMIRPSVPTSHPACGLAKSTAQ